MSGIRDSDGVGQARDCVSAPDLLHTIGLGIMKRCLWPLVLGELGEDGVAELLRRCAAAPLRRCAAAPARCRVSSGGAVPRRHRRRVRRYPMAHVQRRLDWCGSECSRNWRR